MTENENAGLLTELPIFLDLPFAGKEWMFALVRQNKHRVYRLPNGQNVVVSQSPSDRNATQNALHVLKHAQRRSAV